MAKFQKGNPGRPKGSKSYRAQRAFEILVNHNFEPIGELVDLYRKAKDIFDNYAVIYGALSNSKEASGNPFPVEDKADKYLKIAADTAKELAGYVHPKLKSIEHTHNKATDGMTREERIAAHEAAIQALKAGNG